MLRFQINEQQRKSLIVESLSNDIKKIQEESYLLVKKVLDDTKEQIGVNLSMLLTWGASIGGFMSPVMQWLQNKNPELSSVDVSLISTAIICVLFTNSKEDFTKLMSEIKKRKLSGEFKSAIKKSNELKFAFLGFLGSLNISLHNLSNMLSYAFLVPILPLIYSMTSSGELSSKEIDMIVRTIASFGFITFSGNYLKRLIDVILKRFKD